MIKIERNLKRLNKIAGSLDLVAESINQELYSKKSLLHTTKQLNLETDGLGILDNQVQRLEDDIKFMEAQADLLQSCIVLARME
tara:strand:- start:268 stop:519 length:252 start_codon:yes stop_codon:yes gene_type:complete